MRSRISKLRRRGSSIVETVCGCIILVIIALFLVDVAAVVICQTQNDALAKHCATAAAAQPTQPQAQTAVTDVTSQFVTQNGTSKICLFNNATLTYNGGAATAYVKTVVTCNFPVPIPFGPAYLQFQADNIQPIVATLP